jgi:hypothetical protein
MLIFLIFVFYNFIAHVSGVLDKNLIEDQTEITHYGLAMNKERHFVL